ncbi:hypothetical protein M9458_032010, partial [Cirrhinus mrigala]
DEDEEEDFSSHDEPSSACSTDTRQSTGDLSESGQGSQAEPSDPTVKEECSSPHRPKRASFPRGPSPLAVKALPLEACLQGLICPHLAGPVTHQSPLPSAASLTFEACIPGAVQEPKGSLLSYAPKAPASAAQLTRRAPLGA